MQAGDKESRNDFEGRGDEAAGTCVTRRSFLLWSGATTVALSSIGFFARPGFGQQPVAARVAEYPRKRIVALSELTVHQPLTFHYPYEEPHCSAMLVKLGTEAGGAVGAEADIVAFSHLCTHQGGLLEGQYQSEYRVLGPCPIHLTTFDLTRHGMVVTGHATQGLPQVMLEVDGDHIVAVGVMGLIYGYADNRAGA